MFVHSDHTGRTGTINPIEGQWTNFYLVAGKPVRWRNTVRWQSNKLMNSRIRSSNGNRETRNIIKIAHWNMGNSLWQNKRVEIDALVLDKQPDVLYISEANLMDTLPDSDRYILGYSLHLPSTMGKHNCSRIVCLVRDGIEVRVHREWMNDDVAVVWISIKNGNKGRLYVGGVYREHQMLLKPKPNPTKTLDAQLERWNKFLIGWKKATKNKNVVLIGDTNLDYLRWLTPDQHHEKMVQRPKDVFETAGHIQIIKGATRTWRGQVDSLVDHVWLDKPQRLISHHNELRGSSDHNLIYIILRTKDRHFDSQEIFRRSWKLFSAEKFKLKLSEIDWTPFWNTDNLDQKNTFFEENVGRVLQELAPLKNSQVRKNYKNWVDDDLKISMRERDCQRETAKISDSQEDWMLYRKMRNQCSKKLKKKKNDFMTSIFDSFKEKNYLKNIFRTSKELLGWSSPGQPSCLMDEGRLFKKPSEVADILRKFFENKIQKIMSKMEKNGRDPLEFLTRAMNTWSERKNLPVFNLRKISLLEAVNLIKGLGNSKSFGRDYLDAFSLKCAVGIIAPLIRELVNSSISESTYIMKWKQARTIPILKSTEVSRLLPSSYHPISLLPVVSKLVERAVQQQLLHHFEQHNLLHPNGHAYRPHLSTNTAMTQLMDTVYTATDMKMITSMMAMDQSAAFDCVSHTILLKKLRMYNCSTETIAWIEDYLRFRSQQIVIGKHCSRISSLYRGVPQGSILGPLLYLIYTNEIADTVRENHCNSPSHLDKSRLFGNNCNSCGTLITYADDLTLIVSNKNRNNNQVKLNVNLARLEIFLNSNELAVNTDKTAITELMIKQKQGRTNGNPPHLIVQDKDNPGEVIKISNSNCFRILGCNIQPNITWKMHLETGKKSNIANN